MAASLRVTRAQTARAQGPRPTLASSLRPSSAAGASRSPGGERASRKAPAARARASNTPGQPSRGKARRIEKGHIREEREAVDPPLPRRADSTAASSAREMGALRDDIPNLRNGFAARDSPQAGPSNASRNHHEAIHNNGVQVLDAHHDSRDMAEQLQAIHEALQRESHNTRDALALEIHNNGVQVLDAHEHFRDLAEQLQTINEALQRESQITREARTWTDADRALLHDFFNQTLCRAIALLRTHISHGHASDAVQMQKIDALQLHVQGVAKKLAQTDAVAKVHRTDLEDRLGDLEADTQRTLDTVLDIKEGIAAMDAHGSSASHIPSDDMLTTMATMSNESKELATKWEIWEAAVGGYDGIPAIARGVSNVEEFVHSIPAMAQNVTNLDQRVSHLQTTMGRVETSVDALTQKMDTIATILQNQCNNALPSPPQPAGAASSPSPHHHDAEAKQQNHHDAEAKQEVLRAVLAAFVHTVKTQLGKRRALVSEARGMELRELRMRRVIRQCIPVLQALESVHTHTDSALARQLRDVFQQLDETLIAPDAGPFPSTDRDDTATAGHQDWREVFETQLQPSMQGLADLDSTYFGSWLHDLTQEVGGLGQGLDGASGLSEH